jgi:hypothetical protein
MPAWIIPVAEALFVGIGSAFAVHQTGGDVFAAVMAGIMATLAKFAPTQITGKK